MFTTVREVRESRGMTQAELARELGVKRSHLNDWEHGRKRLPKSHALKVNELLGGGAKRLYRSHEALVQLRRAAEQGDATVGLKSTTPEVAEAAIRELRTLLGSEVAEVAAKQRSDELADGPTGTNPTPSADRDATGVIVVQGADGNWWTVDPTTSPPTVARVQGGQVVQQQGQPAGTKARGHRDSLGRAGRR